MWLPSRREFGEIFNLIPMYRVWQIEINCPLFVDLQVLSREWMGMGVAGIIIHNYCGAFPHSLQNTSK